MERDRIILGDSRTVLKTVPAGSVDLVMTSPPYAERRHHSYGGIPADQYVAWFRPIAAELERVLAPSGSFVLNIKESVIAGERHTYVFELVLALRAAGWRWIDDYCWHKKNAFPGKWPNRFRDAWEHCFHFTKEPHFQMFQDAVRVPASPGTKRRAAHLGPGDERRVQSRTGSGLGRCLSACVGRELVYPSNVLHLAPEARNREHSAAFPLALPSWFIHLFTKPGDLVLDPFCGSGDHLCRRPSARPQLPRYRLPRAARADGPAAAPRGDRRVRLTAQRRDVLRQLVEYVHISTTQWYRVLGAETPASQRAVRRLLRDAATLGLLRRERLVVEEGQESRLPHWEYLYWLSPDGLRLARDTGLDPHGLGKASDERSPLMLAHEQAITAFHLALNAALGEPVWWRQKDLKHAFTSGREDQAVNPDALFFAGHFYCFLEIEKTKLGRYRDGESGLLRKCRSYLAYADSGARPYLARWPEMEGFFVCITVAGEPRQQNFVEALRTHCPYSLFLVATEEASRTDILGRIWRTPTGALRSLLD